MLGWLEVVMCQQRQLCLGCHIRFAWGRQVPVGRCRQGVAARRVCMAPAALAGDLNCWLLLLLAGRAWCSSTMLSVLAAEKEVKNENEND